MTEMEMRPLKSYAAQARRLGFLLLWDDEIVGRFGARGKVLRFTVRLEPVSHKAKEATSRIMGDGVSQAIQSGTIYRSDDKRVWAIEESAKQAIGIAASVMA
jgi:hypothetical protein